MFDKFVFEEVALLMQRKESQLTGVKIQFLNYVAFGVLTLTKQFSSQKKLQFRLNIAKKGS